MNAFIVLSLIFTAILHAIPTIGLLGAGQIVNLYGIATTDEGVILLLRHRAVLFGLLAALFIMAARLPALRTSAIGAGLISTLSFCALATSADLTNGPQSEALHRVVQLDLVAAGFLAVAACMHVYSRTPKPAPPSVKEQ